MRSLRNKIHTVTDDAGNEFTHRLYFIRRMYMTAQCPNPMRFFTYVAKVSFIDTDKPPTPRDKRRWKRLGRRYGFPACCVKSFCNQSIADRTEYQKETMRDGFVPCPNHADLLKGGHTTIEDLIRDRKHKLPFPLGY